MTRPFTAAWAERFHAVINADAHYREAARSWHWPVALLLEPARPELGYPEPVAVEVDLDRGTCRSARLVPGAQASADIILGATYETWKQVVSGTLDPVAGVAMGKLKLVKGSLMTLMLHTGAAKALVGCAAAVGTEWPDEA